MSAASPYPSSSMDQKSREPSMEEILASIRRIIADDQSIPRYGSASEASPLRPTVPIEAPTTAAPEFADEPVAQGPKELPDGFYQPEIAIGDGLGRSASGADRAEARAERHDPTYRHGPVTPQFPGPSIHDDRLSVASPLADARQSDSAMWPPVPPAMEPEVPGRSLEPDPANRHGHSPVAPTAAAAAGLSHPMPSEAEVLDETYDTPIEPEGQAEPEEAPTLFSATTDTAITSAFNMLAATRLADNSEELKGMVREMIRPLLRSWLDDNLPVMVERMVRAEIERVARGGR